jgi:uncharacterized membrane protein YccC
MIRFVRLADAWLQQALPGNSWARPAPWQILFSLKAFAAAMLALYIAYALDLQRPYWAMTTVYVVSQPFAGAIRSKGMFRLGGTILGAAAGVFLYSVFGGADLAMMAGLVCWLYFCGYFALSDRSPRSYFFLLAGLTALLVGWPGSSMSSGPIFENALARIEEIGLGILCAVLVDSIFFPRRIGPLVDSQIADWFRDAKAWARDVLDGKSGSTAADRSKLAADAAQIDTMLVHLDYEMQDNPRRARWLRILQNRMLLMLPILSSIDDRLGELRGEDAVPVQLGAILSELRNWFDAGAPPDELRGLKRRVESFDPHGHAGSEWHAILLVSLAARLAELLNLWTDYTELWRQAQAPQRKPPLHLARLARETVTAPHRDPGMIVWAMAASFLSFLIAAAFWVSTGWPQGSTAAMMALLMSLFFGTMDDPVPMLRLMIKVLCFAIVLDTLYLFVIMPATHSFPTLVIAFIPALIPLGILASEPATFMIALMPIAMITLQSTAFTGFAAYINGMLGMIFGVSIVFLVSAVVKSIGADVSARRILHAGWRDLEALAGSRATADAATFTNRMLDRLALLAPRLAAADGAHDLQTADALSDLRLGLSLIELQRWREELSGEASERVRRILICVSRYFHRQRTTRQPPVPSWLVYQIDKALLVTMKQSTVPHRPQIVLALAGIRRGLFAHAPKVRGESDLTLASPSKGEMALAAE